MVRHSTQSYNSKREQSWYYICLKNFIWDSESYFTTETGYYSVLSYLVTKIYYKEINFQYTALTIIFKVNFCNLPNNSIQGTLKFHRFSKQMLLSSTVFSIY